MTNIICSHLDPDHIGGLKDFPGATVHVSREEYESFKTGNDRYLPYQLSHHPTLKLYEMDGSEVFGLPARKVNIDVEIYLIPLFGHTTGHCGVAIKDGEHRTFYVGDAYYLRAKLGDKKRTVDQLASIRAMDNELRLASLEKVRDVVQKYGNEIDYFGYHNPSEFID